MEHQIRCECGATVTVAERAAGTEVLCACGQSLSIPSLSALKKLAVPPPIAQAPTRRPLSLRKRVAFSLLTSAVAIFPIMVLLEIGYRWWHAIPLTGGIVSEQDLRLLDTPANRFYTSMYRRSDNPILFYELRPGATRELYSINSQGFRDHECSEQKPAGTFRIVVLGDSIAWGHMLPLDQTFAKQLEARLNAKFDHKFEVLNFGVSGYSTQQEVELYRVRASRFHPDLVIVCYCLNDFGESSVESTALKRAYYDIFSKSYVYDHLRRLVVGVAHDQFGRAENASPAQFNLRQQFARLDKYCAEKGLVIIFPNLSDFENYFLKYEHERVGRAIENLNFELLDLLDYYRRYDADQLVLRPSDRTHPNELGNRIAAEAAMQLLIEKKMIPVIPRADRSDAKATSTIKTP